MKRPKLLAAALVLLLGAASAAGGRLPGGAERHAQGAPALLKHAGGS